MNFDFLKRDDHYYELFADGCIEAEKVFATSPAMCAVGCRKALELAVKWVYAADSTIKMPYKDNLASLLHEYSFKSTRTTSPPFSTSIRSRAAWTAVSGASS